MSITAAHRSVKQSIVVEAPIAHAFKVFTERFGKFKQPQCRCVEKLYLIRSPIQYLIKTVHNFDFSLTRGLG